MENLQELADACVARDNCESMMESNSGNVSRNFLRWKLWWLKQRIIQLIDEVTWLPAA